MSNDERADANPVLTLADVCDLVGVGLTASRGGLLDEIATLKSWAKTAKYEHEKNAELTALIDEMAVAVELDINATSAQVRDRVRAWAAQRERVHAPCCAVIKSVAEERDAALASNRQLAAELVLARTHKPAPLLSSEALCRLHNAADSIRMAADELCLALARLERAP